MQVRGHADVRLEQVNYRHVDAGTAALQDAHTDRVTDPHDPDPNAPDDCRPAGDPAECTFCGDGTVDPHTDEQCDDGNEEAGDGCSPECEYECLLDVSRTETRELATLPRKMEVWSRFIPTARLPGTSPEHVRSLATNLQGLTYRVQDMLEARRGPHAPFLIQELTQDLRDWRHAMQRALRRLSEDPGGGHQEFFRARLGEILGQMEDLVDKSMDKAADDQISPQEGDNFYRLLGAFRGVSEALVAYAGCAAAIDWEPWRETRLLR